MATPVHIDIKRTEGITIGWDDGQTSVYSTALLRKMSPAADQQALRRELEANPLAILPADAVGNTDVPLTITDAHFVGNYAIQITFSDEHSAGIYTWEYLRQLDSAISNDSTITDTDNY